MPRGVSTVLCGVCAIVALLVSATGCGGGGNDLDGTIAFVRGDHWKLFVADASGGHERQIGNSESISVPAWSPHGDEIAYGNGSGEVVITSLSGTDERRIAASCYGPVWSPRADRIACDYTEPWEIRIVDPVAKSVQTITADCCSQPAWSPDGRQIAYYSMGEYDEDRGYVGPSGTFVMAADGSRKRRLTPHGSNTIRPAWSPDGRTIALSDGAAVWSISPDGTGLRTLLPADGTTRDLAWSPDSTTLAFTHGDGHDFEVFAINADGSGLGNLTENNGVHDRSPAWSPDGSAIAFSSNRDGNSGIYTMNADGTDQTRITDTSADDQYPQWAPAR